MLSIYLTYPVTKDLRCIKDINVQLLLMYYTYTNDKNIFLLKYGETCSHMLQLKVKIGTTFIKGHLVIVRFVEGGTGKAKLVKQERFIKASDGDELSSR